MNTQHFQTNTTAPELQKVLRLKIYIIVEIKKKLEKQKYFIAVCNC